jgi:hypothetical protein
MPPLDRTLRRNLETAIKAARRVAERGAAKALDSLAVGSHEPWSGQPAADRVLRVKLRARGRQLGDALDPKTAKQETGRLVHEAAYEHWHRMLFARFLAENGLLIEPESGVAIDLDTCRDLAKERGTDVWVLASRFAQAMLPEIFRADDPVLAVELALEDRAELEALVAGLGSEVFTASDSLGWCYQFWQTEKKKAVNDSGVEIGAAELPAVTQLFTEDYMVDFLLDNTLGAWWAGKKLAADPSIAATADTEDELRAAVSLPGTPWAYLRFIKDEDGEGTGVWRPAADTFDGWPKAAKDLTCLDPCMGSGHFVVAMFERLVPLRMSEEGLPETAAIQAVIRDNLFGLEIDPRCTQIGAFNLALAAWRRVGHCLLPAMHIACSGLAPNATEDEWAALAEGNSKLEEGIRRLHGLFKDAPVLGSLIDPRAGGHAAFEAAFAELQPILEKALAKEGSDDAKHEMAVTARGVATAADILGRRFALVATNVPYLSVSKHPDALRDYGIHHHSDSRHDLATVFVERWSAVATTIAVVTPQNWLFQPRYKRLRQRLLQRALWQSVVALGPGAFETITGEVVKAALVTISNARPQTGSVFWGIDLAVVSAVEEKAARLRERAGGRFSQEAQVANPDSRVVLAQAATEELLVEVADSRHGIRTADGPRFLRTFWELDGFDETWVPEQSTTESTRLFAGRENAIRWDRGGGELKEFAGLGLASLQGGDAWGKQGVVVSLMGSLPVTRYAGDLFDNNCAALWPRNASDLPAVWAFCSAPDFNGYVRLIDQQLKVTSATLLKIPFDRNRWEAVAAEAYPDGLPKPFSSDPTQWLFNGHPKGSDHPLQAAVARLVGYRWPRQTGSEFPDCPALGPDGLESHADADGIVCLSSVRGEATAADRLLALLADAYGGEWTADIRDGLLTDADSAGKSLDDWLRDSFFEQHLKLFHQRPFVWHVWDGLRDGFNCLVNYHKLAGPGGEGRRTLEKVAYEYLGDWIGRQKAQQAAGEEGSDARVAAAEHLQGQLAKIIEGEPPFDLFVRWKPLSEQAIGWEPDINDGVRLNIRPFMTARPIGARARKACILRAAPGIKWDKDRGNEPDRPKDQFPWFWAWDEAAEDFIGGKEFDGKRHNDLHYSRKAKEAVRAKAAGGKQAEART